MLLAESKTSKSCISKASRKTPHLFHSKDSVNAEEVIPTTESESLVVSNVIEERNVDHEAEEVSIVNEYPTTEYKCDLCEFTSTWVNGLALHVSSMHELIGQDKLKSEEDIVTMTQSYWKTGKLECNLQVYINALMDVEKANLDDAIKEVEEQKLENLWKEIQSTKQNSSHL